MTEEQDPLEFLPEDRWSELQNVFKANWPRGVSVYAAIEIQKRWKELGIDYDFKVYCPYGDVFNGMVALNIKETMYEIIIQCPKDDTEKLEDALRKTKIIDWNKQVSVLYAPQHVFQCLQKVVEDLNVEMTDSFPLDTYILEKTLFDDVRLPLHITLGPVRLEDVELVDSVWPHRYPGSLWYFKLLISANYSYGLYLGNSLICWVFFKETGALLHMYTLEEYRRKGYAELLLKLVSKGWIKEGLPMLAFCLKNNMTASKLYRKIGFVKTEEVYWFYFNKKVQ